MKTPEMTKLYAPGLLIPFRDVREGQLWAHAGKIHSSKKGVRLRGTTEVFVQPAEMVAMMVAQRPTVRATSCATTVDLSLRVTS